MLLSRFLIKDPANTFILRVYGDSMEGAGIYNQDEIIVDRSIKPRIGQVAVASLSGKFTVKRLDVGRKGRGWLSPENSVL